MKSRMAMGMAMMIKLTRIWKNLKDDSDEEVFKITWRESHNGQQFTLCAFGHIIRYPDYNVKFIIIRRHKTK